VTPQEDFDMPNSERMASIDTTWLRMDRPANHMVILGIIKLAGPVDVARIEQTLATRLLAYRRFRQTAELGLTGSWWRDDPGFDIRRHILRVRLPDPAGKAELQGYVAGLAAQPLDRSHPLWQYHIVENFEGGAALIGRIHHAVGDGMALMGVLMSLTDERPDARTRRRPPPADAGGSWLSWLAPVGEAVQWGWRTSGDVLRGSAALASDPGKILDALVEGTGAVFDGTGVAAELGWLLFMPEDSRTRFKGPLSGHKRVAWSDPIALPEVRVVGRALGCSVNDMLLAAVSGALNGYLKQKGDDTAGVEVRALVPINLRPPTETKDLGNRFGILAVVLPVGLDDPLARLYEVHRRMEELKSSYEPAVTLGLLAALGHAPKLVQDKLFDLLLSRATAVMTNVPGPQKPLYLAGSRIEQIMFWVPQSGDIGMGVSILSFNGQVQFGLITDAALVPDPEAIIDRFRPEFEQLLYYVLMLPWPALQPADKPESELADRKPAKRRKSAPRAPRRVPKRFRAMT
jgi:diacylglycerol O-acyltransferase / wax synthase